MKVDEIKALVDEIRLEHLLTNPKEIFVRSEDVAMDVVGKGDMIESFPAPECSECALKCCPPRLELSFFDIARLMDKGLDKFIGGTFEGYMGSTKPTSDSDAHPEHSVPYISCDTIAIHCVFLDGNERCGIYDTRAPVCRSFPLKIRQNAKGELVAQWEARCRHYKISSDKAAFLELYDSAIRSCNEWICNHMLMIHAREQLRKIGFDKYLGEERHYLRQ